MSNKITYCAEIGSSHCGSLDLALAHIRAAKEAGATAVKFQLFRAESLDSRPEVQEKLRPYELPLRWLDHLSAASHAHGMQFGVTPFDPDLVRHLQGFIDFIKISAYDLTFDALITEATKLGVTVVLSTAMGTEKEIIHAWGGIPQQQVVLLHGVAAYPAQLVDYNLRALPFLRDLGACPVGISDHTIGHKAAMIAVTLGATWIEKHFRLNSIDAWEITKDERLQDSPDYLVSATPFQFANMVGACERAKEALGTGEKNGPLACEIELYRTCRRTNKKRVRG